MISNLYKNYYICSMIYFRMPRITCLSTKTSCICKNLLVQADLEPITIETRNVSHQFGSKEELIGMLRAVNPFSQRILLAEGEAEERKFMEDLWRSVKFHQAEDSMDIWNSIE